jgi:hypothetical protein
MGGAVDDSNFLKYMQKCAKKNISIRGFNGIRLE